MKKIIALASVLVCISSNGFAENTITFSHIFNNSDNHDRMIAYYKVCGRPRTNDHLDCLPGTSSVIIPSRDSVSVTLDPGYFVNITHVIEKDNAGHIDAETYFDAYHRCESFDEVSLTDNGSGGIMCSNF